MIRLILLILMFFIPVLSSAQIITGEVEYNEENARAEVFSKPLKSFNMNYVHNFLIDINNNENLLALYLGKTEFQDRKIVKFSDGSYGVQYYDDPMFSWYYSSNGRLISFIEKDSLEYPCKITKYKPDGSVANAGYRVSKDESYIFSNQGRLIAHWIGENCYDEYNRVIMTRHSDGD